MLLKILVFSCLVACSLAWLAPERCSQNKKSKRSADSEKASTVPDIKEIAAKQHEELVKSYSDYEFFGVPIRIKAKDRLAYPDEIEVHSPFNCTFYTYKPRLLATVACSNAACKLQHTVSTTDTYTSSEGYNWGAKVSSKFSLFEKVFEIGGEVSSGGTYTCTFTKGVTTTDLVECSDSSQEGGHLRLYNVRSDMLCDFGQVTYDRETRDGNTFLSLHEPENYFSPEEIDELKNSAEVFLDNDYKNLFLLDTDKISDRLLQKFKETVPTYNPFTDLLLVHPEYIGIVYYKKASARREYRRIIPFTNDGGDSVYQYACTKIPF